MSRTYVTYSRFINHQLSAKCFFDHKLVIVF